MSSTDVKIFEKEEFGSVRVVMQGDDPWFVASDVAKSLGYDNPANAINTHCKKINKITLSPDLGGREISSEMGHRRHPRHPEFSGCGNRRLTSSL